MNISTFVFPLSIDIKIVIVDNKTDEVLFEGNSHTFEEYDYTNYEVTLYMKVIHVVMVNDIMHIYVDVKL